jgi:hypothetical protein
VAELRNPLLGHAVTASEVAAVRDGDSQIINPAVMKID